MTTQNKILSALLALIVIISVVWLAIDHRKTERQYKTCLEICEKSAPPGISKYISIFDRPSEYSLCIISCKEKYGK